MIRPTAARSPAFDIFDDLMAISRIEATLNTGRRKTPQIRDYTRLSQVIPGLKL